MAAIAVENTEMLFYIVGDFIYPTNTTHFSGKAKNFYSMAGINTEIENELNHELRELQQEHDVISQLFLT